MNFRGNKNKHQGIKIYGNKSYKTFVKKNYKNSGTKVIKISKIWEQKSRNKNSKKSRNKS
jgi:hypothetical protein